MSPPTSGKSDAKPQIVFMPTLSHHDEGRTRGHSRMVRSASMRNALARKKQTLALRRHSPSTPITESSPETDVPSQSRLEMSLPSPGVSTRKVHSRNQLHPFDIAPVKNDPQSLKLLRMYLTDWYEFTQYEPLDSCFLYKVSQPPHTLWAPSIFGSAAGVYVMLAYMASTQAGKWAGAGEHYGTYMASALRETNRMLAEPFLDAEAISHLLYIVLGLMILSRRSGDYDAAETHRNGAWALLEAAKRCPNGQKGVRDKVGKHHPVDCMFLDEWHEPRAASVRLASLLQDPEIDEVRKPGNGFADLHAARLLSCNTIRKCRWLTHKIDGADLVPMEELDTLFDGLDTENARQQPYELITYASLRIISHCLIFKSSAPSCVTLTNLLRLAESAIHRLDMNHLLENHPSFVMWWILITGAAAVTTPYDAESGTTIHPLLVAWRDVARERLNWSFDEAVESCRTSFFWFPRVTANAQRFWRNGVCELDSFEFRLCQCADLAPEYPPDGPDAGIIDVLLAHSVQMELTNKKV